MSKFENVDGSIPRYKNQCFSRTDLDTNQDDIGIVFPLIQANMQPSFSSIVEHEEDRTILAHSEYRIANSKDEDIEYFKGRCLTYVEVKAKEILPSECEALFEIEANLIPEKSYFVKDSIETKASIIKDIKEMFNSLDFTPDMSFISKENLSKKEFKLMKSNSLFEPSPDTYNYSAFSKKDILEDNKELIKDYCLMTKQQYSYFASLPKDKLIKALEEIYTELDLDYYPF